MYQFMKKPKQAIQPFLIIFLFFIFVNFLPISAADASSVDAKLLEKAKKIHENAVTLDTHVDIPGSKYGTGDLDPGIDNPKLRCDLVKMEKGRIDGVFLAVFVDQKQDFSKETYVKLHQGAIDQFKAIKAVVKKYPTRAEQAYTVADVQRIVKSGKRAIIIGIENGYALGDDFTYLREYQKLGTRYITLCHWNNNQICDAATAPAPKHNGVSPFGEKVIAEMNRLGIICDCSHISEKSFYDLIKLSKAPIIASHSGCYALTPHKRNLTDHQLRALTKNGGVAQIVAVKSFLEPLEHYKAFEDLRKKMGLPETSTIWRMSKKERAAIKPKLDLFREKMAEIEKTIPNATLATYVDHIDHAVKIAGIDHVGIGTDFDGGGSVPGFENHGDALNVTVELVRRGYSEEDIIKIWGGNLLRVWKKVEEVARNSK